MKQFRNIVLGLFLDQTWGCCFEAVPFKKKKKSKGILKGFAGKKEEELTAGQTAQQGFKKKNLYVSGRRKMKCSEVIEVLGRLVLESCACDWDNPGLLAGRSDKEVKNLYCLRCHSIRWLRQPLKGGADMFDPSSPYF